MLTLKIIGAICILIMVFIFAIETVNQANEDAFLREKERQNLKKKYEKSDPK